jgi:hypothetical protein
MAPPPPALRLVLTFISILQFSLAVRIHAQASACLDVGFNFHVDSPFRLAVRIHMRATARFHFCFDLHVGTPLASVNRCRPFEALHRF